MQEEMQKVICIYPQIKIFTDHNFETLDYVQTTSLEDFFLKNIKKYGSAGGFEFVVYDPSDSSMIDSKFYNELIPLKNDIIQAVLMRDNPLNNSYSHVDHNSIQKSVFADPIRIAPAFSYLSAKYDTPYFNWYILLSSKGKTITLHLIVNVETSEFVYYEQKKISRKVNKKNIIPLIYDSFKMIK